MFTRFRSHCSFIVHKVTVHIYYRQRCTSMNNGAAVEAWQKKARSLLNWSPENVRSNEFWITINQCSEVSFSVDIHKTSVLSFVNQIRNMRFCLISLISEQKMPSRFQPIRDGLDGMRINPWVKFANISLLFFFFNPFMDRVFLN
jgi:hypothetical protein